MKKRNGRGLLTESPRPPQMTVARHHSEAEVFVDGSTRQQRSEAARKVRNARAVGFDPSGDRNQPLWIVARCEFCHGAHAHRGWPGIRRAGCKRGFYFVGPHRRRSA